jgi:tetratricopeptide (TPR) repeat protein
MRVKTHLKPMKLIKLWCWMSVKKLNVLLTVFLSVIIAFNSAAEIDSVEYFDPFIELRTNPEGKQLLGLAAFANYDTALAQQQLRALEKTGIANKSLAHKVALYVAKISIYSALNKLDEASRYIDELHLMAVKSNQDWLFAEMFEQQAILFLRRGNFKKSLVSVNKSIKLAEQVKYSATQATALSLRALLYGKMGDFSQAIQDTLSALVYFEARRNNRKIAGLYSGLVTIYLYRLDYENAIYYSDKVLVIMDKLPRKDKRQVVANYINRAIALGNLNRPEEELEAFVQAQNLAIKINDIELLTSIYANLSDYFLCYENYELASRRAKQCLVITAKTKNSDLESICLLNQGLAQVKLGNIASGFADLHQAHKIILAEELNSSLAGVYQMLSEAYEMTNDFEKSLYWYQKYHNFTVLELKKDDNSHQKTLESQFQNTVSRQEKAFQELKSNMLGSVLSQESLIKWQWLAITLLTSIILFMLIMKMVVQRKNRKMLSKNYDFDQHSAS